MMPLSRRHRLFIKMEGESLGRNLFYSTKRDALILCVAWQGNFKLAISPPRTETVTTKTEGADAEAPLSPPAPAGLQSVGQNARQVLYGSCSAL